MSALPRRVVAIIGSGGMGIASARRLASGKTLLLADFSQQNLDMAAATLRSDGHNVQTHLVDVADFGSVQSFAAKAKPDEQTIIDAIVHTAGLSPAMAPPQRIFDVDLLGTANVIDAFLPFVSPGSSLTCISSMARFGARPSGELAAHLATAPRETLLDRPELKETIEKKDSATAYSLSKAGNTLRVQAAARAFAERGARINSISPGVILTAMVKQELESEHGATVRRIIEGSPLKRGGTADEIAAAVAFLAGPEAAFITGTDLLVDGGTIAGNAGALMAGGGKK
ncbi:hypothetical protein QBC35DRAFT_480914 [Podospora australis]|uniref:Uncharacterized protein n=1 Tax=Podospora australis TaxID=1536484 RepID=A0AAN6X388_9PEZI|nr:hypothetical protein QBC35DRAFT_480914 [Podospora australis]